MKKIIVMVLAILAAASVSHAACTQANLKGKWRVYVSGAEYYSAWAKGTLIVSSTGEIAAGQKFTDPEGNYIETREGGSLSVSSNCKVTGSIMDTAYGYDYESTIDEAWMTKGKDFFNGVITSSDGYYFTFTATKY